ncbi:MAG: glycosyltransferase family 4 protein [Bacteroidia bacterium]|nr:glycosyltransferase family 4 protein [Bacteroidia bacterium]
MEIVVNTRLLLKNRLEGIGWFTFETLKRITEKHPEHHFVFLFDRDYDQDFVFSDNVTPIILSPQARHPVLFYIWFEFSVGNFLNKYKPDLFLSPDGYLSLRAHCKQLAVIHDINFEHYPKDVPFLVRKYYRYFFPRFAKKATRIATVSEYSKNDIIQLYGIHESKIDVVYNGCNTEFKAISDNEKAQVRAKVASGNDYFLYVGSLQPRKNIVRLFQAFDQFKKSYSSDVKLVIVGEKYYWTTEIKQAFNEMLFKNEVVFTGRLSTDDLKQTIASALCLTYIPYFEGFGIPILEAMNCGVPVITSNVTSMPEVAKDAALLVNPFKVAEIADAMQLIYIDEKKRTELIKKGELRKLDFSWDKTADLLWSSIENTLKIK